jgi:hypothetical protein
MLEETVMIICKVMLTAITPPAVPAIIPQLDMIIQRATSIQATVRFTEFQPPST